MHYLFDGTLPGLLCCVFEAFEMKEFHVRVFDQAFYQPSVFDPTRTIETDETKADRVWKGFSTRTDQATTSQFYKAFLSESGETYQHLFDLAIYVFQHNFNVAHNYGHPAVLGMSQMAKSVSREKHRMEAFVRFKKANDGLFYALVEPDFNVLPLISTHFKNRYADQPWLIYDLRRKYGIYYDKKRVDTVKIEPNEIRATSANLPVVQFEDAEEALYDQLWKDYFKSTNIVERKNTRLHLQHVPKRYWRYLNEKLP